MSFEFLCDSTKSSGNHLSEDEERMLESMSADDVANLAIAKCRISNMGLFVGAFEGEITVLVCPPPKMVLVCNCMECNRIKSNNSTYTNTITSMCKRVKLPLVFHYSSHSLRRNLNQLYFIKTEKALWKSVLNTINRMLKTGFEPCGCNLYCNYTYQSYRSQRLSNLPGPSIATFATRTESEHANAHKYCLSPV